MTTTAQHIHTNVNANTTQTAFAQRIARLGEHAMLLSTALVLGWIGAMKFTAYEAGAIEGLIASSPLVSWLYNLFSLQGAANLIGFIEVATAITLLVGIRYRTAAVLGALSAIVTFTITLSFMFSAPGWESSLGGFPALSVVPGQFLLKDVVLLAVAVTLLGKALNRS